MKIIIFIVVLCFSLDASELVELNKQQIQKIVKTHSALQKDSFEYKVFTFLTNSEIVIKKDGDYIFNSSKNTLIKKNQETFFSDYTVSDNQIVIVGNDEHLSFIIFYSVELELEKIIFFKEKQSTVIVSGNASIAFNFNYREFINLKTLKTISKIKDKISGPKNYKLSPNGSFLSMLNMPKQLQVFQSKNGKMSLELEAVNPHFFRDTNMHTYFSGDESCRFTTFRNYNKYSGKLRCNDKDKTIFETEDEIQTQNIDLSNNYLLYSYLKTDAKNKTEDISAIYDIKNKKNICKNIFNNSDYKYVKFDQDDTNLFYGLSDKKIVTYMISNNRCREINNQLHGIEDYEIGSASYKEYFISGDKLIFIRDNEKYLQVQEFVFDKVAMQMRLMDAIVVIATKSEEDGLNQIRELIVKNPREFKNSYHRLFLNPNLSKYANVIKSYSRLIDILTFKELSKQTGIINNYMQDSALTYIFLSSKREFMKELSLFVDEFEQLVKNNKQNNTKTNRELLALFKANILISESRDDLAYKIIKENAPYHAKALKALSYFSSIKEIPIFKDEKRLVEAIGVKNFRLKEATFEHIPRFLFDFDGKKVDVNYINEKDVDNILDDVNSYLIKEKIIEKPQKSYKLSIREIKSEANFVRLETVLVYSDGSYVENDYVGDSVFELCIEKVFGKWKVIYDLSRSDVPSEEELKEIRKEFPSQFPMELLSPFWKKMLHK